MLMKISKLTIGFFGIGFGHNSKLEVTGFLGLLCFFGFFGIRFWG